MKAWRCNLSYKRSQEEHPHQKASQLTPWSWTSQVLELKNKILFLKPPPPKKPVGVVVVEETPSLTGEFVGGTHRVLECTQAHPPGNQHQKGPICLWVAGEVTKSQEPSKWHCSLSDPCPTYSATIQWCRLPHPGEHLRLHPLLGNRCAETKKKGPNEGRGQSSRKNTTKQWRDS